MGIRWTKRAVEDLIAIGDFISRDSPVQARRFLDKLIARIDQAVRFPQSGRVVPEFQNREIRELIEDNYRIVYRVRRNKVVVLHIFEGHKLLR